MSRHNERWRSARQQPGLFVNSVEIESAKSADTTSAAAPADPCAPAWAGAFYAAALTWLRGLFAEKDNPLSGKDNPWRMTAMRSRATVKQN